MLFVLRFQSAAWWPLLLLAMEVFAALGLASNIIQFVDFSCKLFSSTHQIYASASGASDRVADAATIASTLNDLCKRLQERPQLVSGGGRGPSGGLNSTLDLLANNCRDVALKLMHLLDSIRAREPQSRWASFKKALQTVLREDDIKALEKQLDDYRRQIVATLQVMQRCVRPGAQSCSLVMPLYSV